MKKYIRLITIMLAAAIGTACSEKTNTPPPTPQPQGVIPQAQLDALNKAKNVENVMMEQADKTREASETQ